ALEGGTVHPGARRYLLDGVQLGGGAQYLFHHPAQLARQRREHGGQLVQQLTRGGARFLVRQHLAQSRGVVVDPREHHGADTGLAEGEEHRAGGGREHRVEDERERRKQEAQPLDLVGGGAALERGIDGRQLDGAGADRRQGDIPVLGVHHRKPRRGGAAQFVVLRGGDGG